jgi:twitching motility protein PilT
MNGIDRLLHHLAESEGSDLHLAAGEAPRWRRDGVLQPLEGERPPAAEEVETLLKAIAPPAVWKAFAAQDDADFAYEAAGLGRFRVSCFRTAAGPAAVFRRVAAAVLHLGALGLPAAAGNLADLERGLVLVAGPTGSGKSTTLAALVDRINRTSARHVVTIEDPVEFVHAEQRSIVSHRQVPARAFADAVRAAMRQDADVILVGELRDPETIELAMTAAEMGALVLGAVQTVDVAHTLDRVVEAFPVDRQPHARALLADTLQGVVAQRLVPTAEGRGRVVAVELLLRTPTLAALLREGRTAQARAVMAAGSGLGMQTLDDALQALVAAGSILAPDARRIAVEPGRFESA